MRRPASTPAHARPSEWLAPRSRAGSSSELVLLPYRKLLNFCFSASQTTAGA